MPDTVLHMAVDEQGKRNQLMRFQRCLQELEGMIRKRCDYLWTSSDENGNHSQEEALGKLRDHDEGLIDDNRIRLIKVNQNM